MHDKYRLEDKEGPLYFSREEQLGYSTCIVKRDRCFFYPWPCRIRDRKVTNPFFYVLISKF
jgi:hypothetical protein